MSSYSLIYNPQLTAYPTNTPESFYAYWADQFNVSSIFPIDQKKVRAIALDDGDTYDFTPGDLAADDGCVIIVKVVGEVRLAVTGADGTSALTGYMHSYGTGIFPGYLLLSTLGAQSFVLTGKADGTIVELFFGSAPDAAPAVRFVSNQSPQVTLTTAQYNDAGTITVPAGTWDIEGNARFAPAGTTVVTRLLAAIGTVTGNSSTSISVPENGSDNAFPAGNIPTDVITRGTPVWRVSVDIATTYYLKVLANFSASTCTCIGFIRATRIID